MSTQIFSCRTYSNSRIALLIATVVLGSVFTPKVDAGTFQWGDIAGTDVSFLDVTEDNDDASSHFAPMPGTGGPIARENSLSLSPRGFSSKSANTSADLIDSTLTTIIASSPGSSVDQISVNILGDYSLGGLNGAQANAEISGSFFWQILEIDNTPVSIATQATNLILGTGAGANGGEYSRPVHQGTGVIWNGIANIDLSGFLNALQIPGKATAVSLIFDHTLQTSADSVSTAFIKSKVIHIHVTAGTLSGNLAGTLGDGNSGASSNSSQIPEPGTALLLIAGCCSSCCYWGCGCRWRLET